MWNLAGADGPMNVEKRAASTRVLNVEKCGRDCTGMRTMKDACTQGPKPGPLRVSFVQLFIGPILGSHVVASRIVCEGRVSMLKVASPGLLISKFWSNVHPYCSRLCESSCIGPAALSPNFSLLSSMIQYNTLPR